jgi:TrkA domain protein
MHTTRTTVLGVGALYDCQTRDGRHLRVVSERGGARQLILYGPPDLDEAPDRLTVRLAPDEADQLADLLRSGSLPDRVAALERRLATLATAERRT